MTQATAMTFDLARSDAPRPRGSDVSRTAAVSLLILLTAMTGLWLLAPHPFGSSGTGGEPRLPPQVALAPPARVTNPFGPLLSPAYILHYEPLPLAQSLPRGPAFERPQLASAAPVEMTPAEQPASAPDLSSSPTEAPLVAETQSIPLPTPRPATFQTPVAQVRPGWPGRQVARQNKPSVPAAAAPADNRGFFEKLFGMTASPSGPVLAYAAPEGELLNNAPGLLGRPAGAYDRWTAVYDIAAHTVYMPDGTRLEAHSGLGERLDDPRFVSERNRGATPPHVYDLTLREQLFHGVEALRLNPTGNGHVFGRTGLLAHTYMLGPNGDSNGCVSFRDYNLFLRAFKNGEVKRLAVVTRYGMRT